MVIKFNNGQVIATFEDNELVSLEDWNGNDLMSTKWQNIAEDFDISKIKDKNLTNAKQGH